MKKIVVLTLLGIAAGTTSADNPETTVITATRNEQPISKILAPLTVLDREAIELLQADDIYDLLSNIPGIVIAKDGGPGSNASIFLRGTNSNHTLILVNSQRIESATLGTAAIAYLSPEHIEKIEVIRGPRASLYGADAVGGVINIITRKQQDKNQGLVKVSAGSNETSEVALGADFSVGSINKLNVSAGINYLEVNGFDSTQDSTGANADDDAYDNTGKNLNLTYSYSDIFSAGISHSNNKGETDYDNICTNSSTWMVEQCKPYTRFEIESSSLFADINPHDSLAIHSSLSRSVDSAEVSDHLVTDTSTIFGGDSFFETERTAASLQGDIRLTPAHSLTLGFDYYLDEVESKNPYKDGNGDTVDELDNHATFVQYQGDFNMMKLTSSVRNDEHETYGNNTTGNIAIGFPLHSAYDLILSYGTAFKAPTFNDMYWPDPYGPGNPDLDPEKSRNMEAGFRGKHENGDWQANLFRNEISELIQWQPVDPNDPYSPWSPFNVNDVVIKGAELASALNLSDWMLNTSYTYTDTEDKATGLELLRRPKHTFSLMLDKTLGDFDLGVTLLAYGSRFDDVANTSELGGYATADLRLAYHPTDFIKFQFKLGNLFDKQYTLSTGYMMDYATEGRTGLLSMIYTPSF